MVRVGAGSLAAPGGDFRADAIALGARSRETLAKASPMRVAPAAAGDHPVRSIAIGLRVLTVDASGSYRLE